jgi:hypothetical protein
MMFRQLPMQILREEQPPGNATECASSATCLRMPVARAGGVVAAFIGTAFVPDDAETDQLRLKCRTHA